jgi:parallel beta-helix repeat protein
MAYSPQTWNDFDPAYPVTAARMAHIEDGVAATATVADGSTNASNITSGTLAAARVGDLSSTYAPVPTTSVTINAASYATLALALTAGSGKTVEVPAGYTIAALTTALAIPANTRVVFGAGCSISVPNGSVINGITLGTGASLIGNGLVLDGGGAKGTDKFGISASQVSGVTIEGVTVQNWHGDGINLQSTDRARVRNCYVNVVTRSDTFFGQGIRLTWASGGATTTNAVISGCHVRSCAGSGIQGDGDWNRTDWRTAGVKIQDVTITDCTSHNNTAAGIWINAGLRCTISNSHADSNADYGFGYEYSQDSIIIGCTANGNTTFGVALFQTNDRCVISSCTATNNVTQGILIKYASLVVGDTASVDNVITGCTATGNPTGIWIENVVRVQVAGCNVNGNNNGVSLTNSSEITFDGCGISRSAAAGARLRGTANAYVQFNGCRFHDNATQGAQIDGAGQADRFFSACTFRRNTSGAGILIPAGVTNVNISGCWFIGNLQAITGSTGAGPVQVLGCNFIGQSSPFSVRCLSPIDWRVIGNTFDEPSVSALDLYDTGGVSGARLVITGNTIKSGVSGLKISAGTGVAGSDYYVVGENTLLGTSPLVYSLMGSVAGIEYRGSGTGSPEGVVYGIPGSMYRRTDGALNTTLYIKETGVGNTGWQPSISPTGQALAVVARSGAFGVPVSASTASGSAPNGTINATPIEIPTAVTLTSIGCEVTAAGESGALLRLGIYADSAGFPGARILDAGTIAANAVATPTITISQALTPGIYWLVANPQAAPTTVPSIRVATGGNSYASFTAAPGSSFNTGIRSTAATYTSGGLPTPFPAGGFRGDGPRVFVQYA